MQVSSLFRRHISFAITLISLLWVMALSTPAQDKQYTESKSDLALRSSARVDPSTLGMSLEIPLGGAPGRSGTNLPNVVRFSSKQWRLKYTGGWQGIVWKVWTKPKFSENAWSGWTSSLEPPRLEYSGKYQPFELDGGSYSDNPEAEHFGIWRVFRIHLYLPDGSSHELRKSDAPTSDAIPDFTTGIFYSTDGSRLRFDAATRVLYLPDGGRYLFGVEGTFTRYNNEAHTGAWATQYIDPNGNTITYTLTNATDTLGRSYQNPLTNVANIPTVQDQGYSVPGVGGQPLNYVLRWRNLADVLLVPPPELSYTSGTKCLGPNSYQTVSPNLFASAYPTYVCADNNRFNPVVLAEIEQPNGQKYQFKYNVYGEIEKIIYPTGGYERFLYAAVPALSDLIGPYEFVNRGVTDRWVSVKGDGTDETHWQYSGGTMVTITAPDLSKTESLLHSSGGGELGFGFNNPLEGMAYEVRTYNASSQMLRRSLTEWQVSGPQAGGYYEARRDPRVIKSVNLVLDTGGNALAAASTIQYDPDLNAILTNRYDFASVDQTTAQTGGIATAAFLGALVRKEEATYLVNDTSIATGIRQTYRDYNLLGLVTSSRIKNSSDVTVAQSQIIYDEAAYMLASYGSVTGWTDPLTNPRGLPTTAKSWLDTTSTWLETHTHYDRCGNPRKATDAKGYVSEVQYSSTYHYAYPTSTISADPDGGGPLTTHTTSTVYDLSSGVVTSSVDANTKTTNLEYSATDTLGNSNPMQRLTRVVRPDGGWTAYGYGYQPGNLFVRTRTALDALRNIESTQYFDGIGRGWRAVQSEGGTSIYVDTQYDSMGRHWKVSNAYRGGETVLWTTTGFDALGRVTSVTTPDTAVVTTAYAGNKVQVTDQGTSSRSSRRSETDALGSLTEVVEFTRTLSNPTVVENPLAGDYTTSYKYDVLGNLRKVQQGAQSRFFMYDSLSRLIRAKNPEQGNLTPDADFPAQTDSTSGTSNSSWSMAYNYDNNGNLIKRKEARNITATYTYDALNRNATLNYSDTTAINPDITRFYDGAINGKGRFWYNYAGGDYSNGTTVEHTAVDSYDAVGRPLIQRQIFKLNSVWGQTYQISRAYNLAGGVTSQTYPSGRTVTYNYDQAGRLGDKDAQNPAFKGTLGDGVSRTYSSGIMYSPRGGMAIEQFGTNTALYSKSFYNSRGQLSEIRVGTYHATDPTWWNRGAIINHYSNGCWGACGGSSSTTSMTDNNGNLKKQEVYIPANEQISSYTTWWQGYDYDALNRLQRVHEYNGNDWQQEYVYDRYGNRSIHQTSTWGTGINKRDFTVNTSNNQLGVPGGQSGTMTYDNAGNLTNDSYTGAGSRTYDAETRMTQAFGGANQQQFYTYDADGQRVRRKVDGVETWQVYGMDGELLAEYTVNAVPASPQKEYGYRSGQLLITAAGRTENVTWTNAVGVTVSGNSLTKTAAASWGNAGASSTQALISGDGYVEFTANETSTSRMCGLSNGDSNQNYTDIDFALYPTTGSLQIYEAGISRGAFGTYAVGDRLRVAVEGGVVKYRKNGTLLYTSSVSPTYPLLADAALHSTGSTIMNVAVSGNLSANGGTEVNWLVADQLGTPRMIIDKTGNLASVKRHDYLPFGEELIALQGLRTTGLGYTSDTVRQKFTAYERDSETNMDFAQARYFANVQGRFTSVDPLMASGKVGNAQTWNRYAYGLNNPLRYVDPTGMDGGDIDTADDQQRREQEQKPKPPAQPQEEPIDSQDVVTVNATGPRIVSFDVTLINTVPGTGSKAPFAEVPIGGQFQVTYTYVTAVPNDGSKAADHGYLAPVAGSGTLGSGTTGATLVDSKINKMDVEKNNVTVTKTDVFTVKQPDNSNKVGASGTFAINYRIVARNPNTGEKVWTSSTGKRYPEQRETSGLPPAYPKKSPPAITVRHTRSP